MQDIQKKEDTITEADQANLEWINSHTEETLSTALLIAFSNPDGIKFDDLELSHRSSALLQLQNLFKNLEPRKQEEFKAATVTAICEWSPSAHRGITLQRLSYLAAYLRASKSIEQFRVIFLQQKLHRLSLDEEYRTTAILLSTIAGFAPLPKVKKLFLELSRKEHFKNYAPIIFLGLCTCEPEDYYIYFPIFANSIDVSKGTNITDEIANNYSITMSEFVRIVSISTIADVFFRMNSDYWKPFIQLLCSGSTPAIHLSYHNREIAISSTNPLNNCEAVLVKEDQESIYYFQTVFELFEQLRESRGEGLNTLAERTRKFIREDLVASITDPEKLGLFHEIV
ncbi:hypothetical protein C1752_16970 [Acaryochloris thomasi RCC1774]|uniref:Uncharacterized protein n=1 Tax=Acaryochloris thomasi RCC1774 TaxID=1764569 RepID=A0A2W1J6H7_9CYAN|nr:hypothetical protein [Acaryochloris thomasi]PZD70199.1 hypothetical protein C1752_16970 [Acaryochloris thomasi RCC1774]